MSDASKQPWTPGRHAEARAICEAVAADDKRYAELCELMEQRRGGREANREIMAIDRRRADSVGNFSREMTAALDEIERLQRLLGMIKCIDCGDGYTIARSALSEIRGWLVSREDNSDGYERRLWLTDSGEWCPSLPHGFGDLDLAFEALWKAVPSLKPRGA